MIHVIYVYARQSGVYAMYTINLRQHRVMATISVYVCTYICIHTVHTAVTCDANYVFVPDSFGAAALSV